MIVRFPYREILESRSSFPNLIELQDHLGGFDKKYNNVIFRTLDDTSKKNQTHTTILYHQFLSYEVKKLYPNLKIKFFAKPQINYNLRWCKFYNIHPELTFQHFLCTFNGSPHVSRKLLVSILDRFGWFSADTCSKNFSYTTDIIDGHLGDCLDPDQHRFYIPFFIGADSEGFFDQIYSFGHVRHDHASNIYNLERQLTSSFLHVVSETLATSYYPFVTEKFLYSVVTRGLFVAYAQPGWHDHLERYYGFRRYSKIFDYRFDSIQNPVERLVEMMSMISKFSVLSSDDWRDLYEMEHDTIEYNYDWYFSKKYIKYLEQVS